MDAVVKQFQRDDVSAKRPSQKEAEEAVRTLLRYIGDDPDREGLRDTPRRVVKSYAEIYGGYEQDPEDVLGRTFEEVAGYDDIVFVKDIPFFSHCEHHMVPIIGKAHVAYLPDGRVLVHNLTPAVAALLHTLNPADLQLALRAALAAARPAAPALPGSPAVSAPLAPTPPASP